MTNVEAAEILEHSMKETYLSALEMIQAFSFGNWKDAETALDMPNDEEGGLSSGMVVGALLGHTRSIFEYASEHMGMSPKEVMRGYGFYFYSNVLTDLEDMFAITREYMEDMDEYEQDVKGDSDDNK